MFGFNLLQKPTGDSEILQLRTALLVIAVCQYNVLVMLWFLAKLNSCYALRKYQPPDKIQFSWPALILSLYVEDYC